MNLIIFSFVFAVSLIGAITDIRYGKVNNRLLCMALIIWLGIIVINYSINGEIVFSGLFFLNLLLALVLAICLYLTDIWAPGDIKLYLFIVLTLPFNCYVCRPGNIFPALDIVIFAFAAGYIFMIIQSVAKNGLKANTGWREIAFDKKYLISVVSGIGFFSVINLLAYSLAYNFYLSNKSLIIIVSMVILILFSRYYERLKNISGLVLFAFYVIYSLCFLDAATFAKQICLCFLLSIVLETLNRTISKNNYREITGEEVRPGMILSLSSVVSMRNCIDQELPKTTTENRRSRLNTKQAAAVSRWCKNAKSNVVIVEMIPFAPFISISLIIQFIRFIIAGR